MSDAPSGLLADIARLLDQAGVGYAVIGGHAVNVWLEPRFTADIDVTVSADPAAIARLRDVLAAAGYSEVIAHGSELPSGPDFVRWVSSRGDPVEIQVAKTSFQDEVIRRAVRAASGVLVATREDLIVLKLIADRGKDRADLEGLCALPDVDWTYVERWAQAWDVLERLARFRARDI
jgi:hypothetical protein